MKLKATLTAVSALGFAASAQAAELIHDAEHYLLEAQHGDRWAQEDADITKKLAALEAKHGTRPNIIHIMWDDIALGEIGIPEIQKVRGFETPHMNKMAEDGINFMRMYTEPACTPTRAAFQTGRYAIRSGMHTVSFPVEYSGMDADEVTIAEVLSNEGYMTAFHGKWHLGDTEFSYCHKQGYDEALFTPYNQVPSMWQPQAEAMNVITGLFPELYGEDKYELDRSHWPVGSVWALEGKKSDGKTYEWRDTAEGTNYWDLITETRSRTLDFIDRAVEAKKPFFIAHHPIMTSFIPDPRNPKKSSANKNIPAESLEDIDSFVGELLAHLEEKGIAENTLVIVQADNGPFIHYGPRGMVETLYSGGKGDFTEGGVRVPCIAVWPGVIEPGQIVGDMLHVSDLFTTFARLGGAMDHIPTDRVIDGVDQTSLFLNGDGYSRRDYVMIYVGPALAAGVKGRFKRDWKNATPGLSKNEFYDLYTDPRERTGEMIQQFHVKSMFNRQRQRHEMWIEKYPNRPDATRGPALTGIENVRPETEKISTWPVDPAKLPFDPADVLDHDLPFTGSDL